MLILTFLLRTLFHSLLNINLILVVHVSNTFLKNQQYLNTFIAGKLVSMRHLRNEMSSIETNLECGLRFEDPKVPLQSGDTIICFKLNREKQKLDWDPGF